MKKLFLFLIFALAGVVFAQENLLEVPVLLEEKSAVTITASVFKDVTPGKSIVISYKSIKTDNQQIKLSAGDKVPLTYGIVTGAEQEKGKLIPEKKSGKISYVLTPRDIAAVRKNGFSITGSGLIIKTVAIVEPAPPKSSKKSIKKVSAPNIKFEANPKPEFEAETPFAKHGQLKVNGAYLYDQNNEKFMLYGMSTHGLAWFPQYVNKAALKNLRDDWNTNCIRLALYPRENGGYCAGGNQEQLKNLIFKGIDAATELGMYVIVDWHVLNYNPNELTLEALTFLDEVSQRYAKYDNVIYELCNEPTGSPWDSAIKPYAENLIPKIRKNAPNSLIIVGTNTWSQDIEGPLANPLKYKNVMYAFHFYADTHRDSFRDRVESAIESGLPVFITEFGTCNASGNGGFNVSQSNKWFDLIKEYNISHMNWSLCNKAETASVISADCSKTSDWTYDELSDSGKLIYSHFNTLNR